MQQRFQPAGADFCAATDLCTQSLEALSLGAGVRLAKARVHEAMGQAADMFAVLIAAATTGPIVWVGSDREVGSLAPTALQDFIDPARFTLVSGVTRDENLWAMEQALRCGGAACVIAELGDGPDLRKSRRLQIAAEEGGSLGVVVIAGRAQTSAAQTRWQCNRVCEDADTWRWKLIKNKSGELGQWRVGLRRGEDAPDLMHLVSITAA